MGHLVLEKIPHLKDEIGNMSKGYPLYQLYNIYCIAGLLSMSIKLLSIQKSKSCLCYFLNQANDSKVSVIKAPLKTLVAPRYSIIRQLLSVSFTTPYFTLLGAVMDSRGTKRRKKI